MSARDPYQLVNQMDDAVVQSLIDRMKFRGKDPTFTRMRDAYFDHLPLTTADRVLILGCGPGVNACAVAKRRDGMGGIVGVDQSPAMIDAAERTAREEGLASEIAFQVGDAHALDFPDATFALAIVHTVISHVREPYTVLKELARVVRRGGAIALFDGDYASWTWACADPILGKAMDEGFANAVVSQPRIMRELPRLLSEAGLAIERTYSHLYAEIGTGRFFLAGAETYGPMIARAGLVPTGAVEQWLEGQRQAVERGTFFAACNYYAYIAQHAT